MVELTKLEKEDFVLILRKYKIGRYKKHEHAWWALGNTVYFLTTTKGKYVLKIFEREKDNLSKFNFMISVIDYLNKKQIPVPGVIRTKQSKLISSIKGKLFFVQNFVDGEPIKKFSNELIVEIARKIGSMNKCLLKRKFVGGSDWGEFLFEKINYGSKNIGNFDFLEFERSLIDKMAKIDRDKLRKGIVHSDLHVSHFLVKNDRLVAIIDWDDVHRDYLGYEIAVFIAHAFVSKDFIDKEKIKLFLKEYQQVFPINEEEKKAIYYFMKKRLLGGIAWVAGQKKKHSDNSSKIDGWIEDSVGRYKQILKISFEDFIGLFNSNN